MYGEGMQIEISLPQSLVSLLYDTVATWGLELEKKTAQQWK